MRKLSIFHRINSITMLVNFMFLIIIVFTKQVTSTISIKIVFALSLIIVLVLQIILASRIRKKIRSKKRKENIEFYLSLADTIEKEFNDSITKKEVLMEESAEYKYFFKSDYIEFTLWFDDFFIAYLEKYSQLNHYHFSSWDYQNRNIDLIKKEIRELLDGEYLFGDIFYNNGKVANTFYINLNEMNPHISHDLDSILDDFFDEPVFQKKEYRLKLYGSKKFGENEVIWKSKT
ncbi:MAG: hypothetical protein CVV57_06770 [Tenericutes bacterium HGW-Tenericutes-2]|nr:MAG: hypothetical protein CVV57_06770 [Tenericutes bacterium HGW-Tenericutes-2]